MHFEKGDLVEIFSHEYKDIGIFLELEKLPTTNQTNQFHKIFILDDQFAGIQRSISRTLWFHPSEIRKYKDKGKVNE